MGCIRVDKVLFVSGLLLLGLLLSPRLFSNTFRVAAANQTYYVSNAGSDNNLGTSESSSWQSAQKVGSASLQPGDKVLFKRGDTWTGALTISKSGVQDNPIIIGAYGSGDKPVFRNPGGTWNRAVSLTGSYIVVENILVRDTSEAGIFIEVGAEHNIIQNIEGVALGQAIMVKGNNNVITHNYLHDLVMVVNTVGGDDDYGANGVVIRSSGNEISYNKIVNGKAPSYDYGFDGGAFELYSSNQSMDNNVFHHNWAANNEGFLEVGSQGGQSVANNTFSYNVSYKNEKFASIHLGTTGFGTQTTNMRIENNTIVEPDNSNKQLFWIWSPATPSTMSFTNNIVYSAVKGGASNQIGFTHSHNLFYMSGGASLGLSPDTTDITGSDPKFVNLGGEDFHLQAGSPAINKGVNLGYTKDYEDHAVPIGAAPDIGAYEYGQTVPDATSTPTTTPTPIVKPGDANGDSKVDEWDFSVWLAHFSQTVTGGAVAGDFNSNGKVDGVDYVIWLINYGK
jgi:hypothetical protein